MVIIPIHSSNGVYHPFLTLSEKSNGSSSPKIKLRACTISDKIDLETRLTEFETYLKKLDRSRHSVRAYLSDLRLFAQWFEGYIGEKFVVTNLIDEDVKNWRGEMEKKQKASTVNRKLAAVCAWGKKPGFGWLG
jgi:hypothetical protein